MADSVEDDENWLYSSSQSLQEDNNVIITKETEDPNEKEREDLSQLFDNKSSDDFRQLFDVSQESQNSQELESNNKMDESIANVDEEENKIVIDSQEKDLNQDLGENNNDEDEDDDEEDDDDDDVQVTIGDIKAGPTAFPYGSTPMNLNITKRGATFGSGQGSSAIKPKAGLDIDAVGTINGLSIYDVNLDSLEEKPWRKPGADITDYFNYGFNEDMWKLYCERQKKIRSGGIEVVTNGPPVAAKAPAFAGATPLVPGKGGADQPIPIASVNENSKYTGVGLTKKAGPPPGRKQSGTIDVIGGGTPTTPSMLPSRRPPETKENFIQVIGNRPPGPPGPPPGLPPGMPPFPPMSMPPPFGFPPPGVEFPPGMPPPGMPLIAPNGQPLPFPPGEFPPMRFPHPGILPHPDHHFEEHGDNFHEGMRGSPNKFDDGREPEHDRERDRDYQRSTRGYSREYRDDESYRSSRSSHYRDHHHERDYEHHERSRDREFDKEYESRRHRDRDTKDRDRDKSDSHRERDSRESSSRRRHHEHDYDDEQSRGSSSSRHKHSKRSKRDKEEESEAKH